MSVRRREGSPAPHSPEQPSGPNPVVKWIVTALVLFHFTALFTVVTAAGAPNFPPPPLAVKANLPMRMYVHPIFLSNPYRFYAPNPGPTNVFWFRLKHEYKDDKGDNVVQWRWVEMPRRSDYTGRMPYQRHLSVTMLFDNLADLIAPEQRALSEEGKIVLSSYARRAARIYPLKLNDGTEAPVKAVQFYNVYHGVLEPDQIRNNWDSYDLRLYGPYFYGEFDPEGRRIDSPLTLPDGRQVWATQQRNILDLAVQILSSDLYPVFRKHDRGEWLALMDQMGTPKPIRELLIKYPQLADPDIPATDLKERIEALVQQKDLKDRIENLQQQLR